MLTFFSQNVWNHNPCEYRIGLIRSLIADCKADVCMFQECGPYSVRKGTNPIQKRMSDGYAENCSSVADKNYTPVFCKKERFAVLDEGYLLYDGLNDADSKSVSWVVLRDRADGSTFAAASTHFWWMAAREKDFEQRLANVDQLKAVCDGIVAKHGVPVIIGGDFNNGKNADQGDASYRKMLSLGFRDVRLIAASTTDTLTHHSDPVEMPDETFRKGELPVRTLDHLFVYGAFTGKAVSFSVLTSDEALASSDHCPLIAEIVL